jgi:hypothetical protein
VRDDVIIEIDTPGLTSMEAMTPVELITVIEQGPQGPPGNNTLATAVAGSRFTILWNEVAWPSNRPSARTDIYFDLIGGDNTVANPAWMIDGDAREYVV